MSSTEQPIVDILAQHQPKYLNIGIILDNNTVNAMPCADANCEFIAHVPSGSNGITSSLRHQFAAHQAKMIREAGKAAERWAEHKRIADRADIPDRDGADSAALYAKERKA